MLICSCAVVSDHDIERALLDIMIQDDAPLPTPGVIWRHLSKRMDCCGCAPLAVQTIYDKLDDLERKGLVSPHLCASVKIRWRRLEEIRARKATATASGGTPSCAPVSTFAELVALDVE
ncbi:MAG: hypothetical protein ACK4MF_08635 [Hyphomicrobiaceae bacterium]